MESEGDKFPLGILDEADYRDTRLELASGDKMVFYTDGIVEAMNEKKEIFGFERFLDVIPKAGTSPAEALLKTILNEVNTFVGTAEKQDDITIIVIAAEE